MYPDLASATRRDYFNNQNKSITSQKPRYFVETSSLDNLKYINRMLKAFPEMKNWYKDDS